MKRMEVFTAHTSRNDHAVGYESGFFILSDAGGSDPDLIDKYINQWIAIGRNTDHDDGPDATSRGIRLFTSRTYQAPPPKGKDAPESTLGGGIPWGSIKGLKGRPPVKSWGETAV